MEVLSPRSANLPVKQKDKAMTIQKVAPREAKPRLEEKPTNPDRIDDRWRPPTIVTEPGPEPQTYVVGKKLGKGGFAVCFEGRTQSTSELFALKVVKAKVEQKKMMEKFRTEMQIHAKMKHPNIVDFYRAFTVQEHTYVVLEMCEMGSLTDMVKGRSVLSLPEVRRFMIQICGGVKYMHKRNVIHRDLKMGNIFLDATMNIKIGDFGLAAVLADELDRRTTLCGTPNYIAPEILSKSGTRGHDSKVDVWAIGIICYAMLMGTPPFQSKTQQEIYSKLKTLDYEWKVDSKNHIPNQAKDFVAACLNLVATERPEMDDLVEFDFFKTGVIADVLSKECMRSKPLWLLEAEPRGDRVRLPYGVQYSVICQECGVGRLLDGSFRPSAGEKGAISTLIEIEAENRKGCAPVTPLPEGVLYRQFTDPEPERPSFQKTIAARPRSRKPMEEAREILSGIATRPPIIGAERLPSAARPMQSFAAQQRQQAAPIRQTQLPKQTTSSSVPLPSTTLASSVSENVPDQTKGLLKAKPVRSTAMRPPQPISHGTMPTRSSARLNHLEAQLQKDADQLDKASHSNTFNSSSTVRVRGLSQPRAATLGRSSNRPPSVLSNASSDEGRQKVARAPTNVNAHKKSKSTTTVTLTEIESDFARGMILDDVVPLPSKRIFKPRMIEDKDRYTRVHGTSHTHIMRSLRELHGSLDVSKHNPASSQTRPQPSQPYPRVEKWVDYATKHGIAYLLTDGSLGMILKSREDEQKSSSCVIVRHAKRHTELRARDREHQYVPQGPGASDVEFYEQIDATEPCRRLDIPSAAFKLDITNHSSQSAAANALLSSLRGAESQRLKEVGLLDKFGKYMHKQMGSSDTTVAQSDEEAVGHLIHFYQRLGNVGVWRFADGGIQFNFPDHTKVVIYQGHSVVSEAETLVDMIYLEPRDAKDMKQYGQITHEALERRNLKTWRLSDIQSLNGMRRTEVEIIRTNEVMEKLAWIRAVIGCWLKEQGLGWTGEERLGWSGLQERRDDKKTKLQWVTVGRPGGDGEAEKK